MSSIRNLFISTLMECPFSVLKNSHPPTKYMVIFSSLSSHNTEEDRPSHTNPAEEDRTSWKRKRRDAMDYMVDKTFDDG
ncbi:hypothetical protein NC651_009986 [Populus alba x Populus x berolinensis]|nr:hypothetical protein NC651_009986 [Populus alba x Populus x berolinensis]